MALGQRTLNNWGSSPPATAQHALYINEDATLALGQATLPALACCRQHLDGTQAMVGEDQLPKAGKASPAAAALKR